MIRLLIACVTVIAGAAVICWTFLALRHLETDGTLARPAAIEAPSEPDRATASAELIDVVLRPANRLSIEVRLPDDSIPYGVYVNLSSKSDMFEDGAVRIPSEPRWSAGCIQGHDEPGDAHSMGFYPDADGKVILAGLRPDAEISVQLRSWGREDELLAQSLIVVGTPWDRSITLRSQLMPKRLEGVVRTRGGEPVVGAEILFHGDDVGWGFHTDEEGRFGLTNVFAPFVPVEIRKAGFANLKMNRVPILPGAGPCEFILDVTSK